MNESKIRLLTRGDDGGLNHSSNQAIYDACVKGVLRNVSVMAPAPAFKEMAEMLRGLKHVCAGLHSCLNSEWELVKWGPVLPVEKVRSLVNDQGHFYKHPRQFEKNKPVVDEALNEIRAQLELARSSGLNVEYLDEHMAFGWTDAELQEAIFKLCEKEGIISSTLLFKQDKLKRLPLKEEKGADRVELVLDALKAAPPGTYIHVGHPAYDTEEMLLIGGAKKPSGGEGKNRDEQRRVFMDERIISLCKNNLVTPIRYTEI